MFELVVMAIGLVIIMGLLLGFVIGITARVFAVEQDPRIDAITELLPNANCGGCGFAGCGDFAKHLVEGAAEPDACPVSDSAARGKIGAVLGVEVGEKVRKVAIIRCGGDSANAKFKAEYNGVSDCKSAALVSSGVKGCSYGCLGLGSCARACPFGAIELRPGLAIVHPEICVGCGKCVRTCPKKLIKLVPATVSVHVLCSSPEKGAAKKNVCAKACIGCRKCVKAAGEGQMTINGFLAESNPDNPPPPDLVDAAQCPTGCLVRTDLSAAAVSDKRKEAA